MVKKIKNRTVYKLFDMLDKIKIYDEDEDFKDYIIDPELKGFLPVGPNKYKYNNSLSEHYSNRK